MRRWSIVCCAVAFFDAPSASIPLLFVPEQVKRLPQAAGEIPLRACCVNAGFAGTPRNGYASRTTLGVPLEWGCRLLRRLRTWLLFGALAVCLVLFAGLFHDFSVSDPKKGWFTNT